jgi:hypothetical protein
VDQNGTGWTPTSTTTTGIHFNYLADQFSLSPNEKRPGYPENIRIEFSSTIQDTSVVVPNSIFFVPRPAKFKIFAETAQGDVPLDFGFFDNNGDRTISDLNDQLVIVTYPNSDPTNAYSTWTLVIDSLRTIPKDGDVYRIRLKLPLTPKDLFVFTTTAAKVGVAAGGFTEQPYVVPNPYVGAASFEPARFAVSGRGERRIEFRAIPQNSTIRIYTLRGDLVQTLRQDGSTNGYVAWNLRTKDNLDLAPGLYLFHVDAPGVGTTKGKFAILK